MLLFSRTFDEVCLYQFNGPWLGVREYVREPLVYHSNPHSSILIVGVRSLSENKTVRIDDGISPWKRDFSGVKDMKNIG